MKVHPFQVQGFKYQRARPYDADELAEYRLKKRKEFEDLIRRVYWNQSVWVKYALWEESQKDFARARSVWERALDQNHRALTLWLKAGQRCNLHPGLESPPGLNTSSNLK